MTARSMLVLRGGAVHDDGEVRVRDVVLAGTIIGDGDGDGDADDARDATIVDVSGCTVLPGFVDLQVNGAMGVDLTSEPERLGEVAAFLPQCGVTSFMPTVISSAIDAIRHALDVLSSTPLPTASARSLGVHLEGPFLAPTRAGAHPRHHLRLPSADEVAGWCAGVRPAMVTLAPELSEASAVTAMLDRNGIVVCAGHTEAGPDDIARGMSNGLSGVTHLFNAMGPLSARHPGAAGAVLGGEGPTAELIVGLITDGIHVDPALIRLAWKVLGPQRTALVTDCMAALGFGHGNFAIGDTPVCVGSNGARTIDGVLAGSVLRMDDALRNLIAFTGCSLAEASVAASATPARLARRADTGRLAAGCAADIVVLDEHRRVVLTIIAGTVAFDPAGRCPSRQGVGAAWKS